MAEGLKKAGFFGGTLLLRDRVGTSNFVFPSTVLPVSSNSTLPTQFQPASKNINQQVGLNQIHNRDFLYYRC
ncbi:MAG TPA: hypothetical protein VE593_06940, partial [Nitrososphaeraceae archaeon]|nr:hypothetical protein [Nitrososphaeraceae archaeon]